MKAQEAEACPELPEGRDLPSSDTERSFVQNIPWFDSSWIFYPLKYTSYFPDQHVQFYLLNGKLHVFKKKISFLSTIEDSQKSSAPVISSLPPTRENR